MSSKALQHPANKTQIFLLRKERKVVMTTNDGNVTTPSIMDAWRTVEPEVIVQALRIGEHISDLLTGTARLVQRARWNVDSVIDDAYIRCQTILDRLSDEADRLTPILMLLRAASKAVI
jgi:hypothetical protein